MRCQECKCLNGGHRQKRHAIHSECGPANQPKKNQKKLPSANESPTRQRETKARLKRTPGVHPTFLKRKDRIDIDPYSFGLS